MRVTAAAAFAALALVAAGCGSSSGSGIPAPPAAQGGARFLASAATKSTATPSMKTDLTVTMLSSQLPGGRMEMTATGALDNANHRMNMRLDMSKLVVAARRRCRRAGLRERLGRRGGRATSATAARSSTCACRRSPRLMPGGKPWIKIDLNALGKTGRHRPLAVHAARHRSRRGWSTGSGATAATSRRSARRSSTESRRRTTARRSTSRSIPNLVPADQREAVQQGASTQLTKAAHISSFPMHVWVDEGRPRPAGSRRC